MTPVIQDLGRNVKDMSNVVRSLCKSSNTCLRTILKRSFVGNYSSSVQQHTDFCCDICDSQT